ncbi:MAG: hypothetical protein IJW97_07170 [Clostridia bacterium]|nr:hypothetical protein [Clostridia bacterium]
MKKSFSVLIALLMCVLSMTACGAFSSPNYTVPPVEDMDFSHERYRGEFSYQEFLTRYEDGMPEWVKNLEDIEYEQQSLTSAAQALDYLCAVMADENTPAPLHSTDRIVYALRYDPAEGIWCAALTTQERLDRFKNEYGELAVDGSIGPLVYFRSDGKLLYLEPQE